MTGFIVDLFAGGGGDSEGIRRALGRDPDVAVNHDALADGRVTKLEAANCRREIMGLMQVCMGLLHQLEAAETR